MASTTLTGGDEKRPGWKRGIRGVGARIVSGLRPLKGLGAYFWLTAAMVVVGTLLHYANPESLLDANSPVFFTSHAMDRVLLMVPVIYAGFVFGHRGGFFTLVLVTLVMLPRAMFISPDPIDSLLEVSSVTLVSSLIILWFRGQQAEKQRRLEVLRKLEIARQELAAQVDIITKDERRLATINEICGVVARSLELDEILQRILDKAVEEMAATAGLIFLRDKNTLELELVAHKGVSPEFVQAVSRLKLGDGFNGRVAQSGEPMVVQRTSIDPRLTIPKIIAKQLESQLIVPLRAKGTSIGTLCVSTRITRHFTGDDCELLTAIGSQAGMAIENARLYREVLVSKERYRDLFENATVAIFVHDLQGVITAANKACAALTAFPLDELIGLNVSSLFPQDTSHALYERREHLLKGGAARDAYDTRLVKKDGSEVIVSLTTRLVLDEGEPNGFQHIARNVTTRRRMEETLNYYVRQILTAQEEERKRIARELHDETAQSLLLILQRMDSFPDTCGSELAPKARRDLEALREVLLETLDNLRRFTQDLRPQILDDLGLIPAVEWLAGGMEKQTGISTQVKVIGQEQPLSPEAQVLLFRIAQEALSNVRRHSEASRARVKLEFSEDKVRLSIEDNGQGFVPPDSLGELGQAGKLGILGMSERARLAGGSIHVQSAPSNGTTIIAEFHTR